MSASGFQTFPSSEGDHEANPEGLSDKSPERFLRGRGSQSATCVRMKGERNGL